MIKDKKNKYVIIFKSPSLAVGIVMELFVLIATIITDGFNGCSIIVVIQTFLAILIIANAGYGFVSVPAFFVLFSFIFHCSQFVLYSMRIEYNVAFDIVHRVGTSLSICVMKYFIISSVFLTIGLLVKRNPSKYIVEEYIITDKKCCELGKTIMWCCALPRLYTDLTNVITYINYGYDATYSAESGLLLLWAYGFYIGVLFYVIGNRQKTKYTLVVITVFSCYLLAMMVSGRRLEQAAVLLTLLIIYIRYCRKEAINKRRLLGLMLAGYVFLAAISTMGDMRYATDISFFSYFTNFLKNLAGKMLTGQLAEFGDTGMPLACAIISFPKYHSFHYGLTYIFAWVQILPNVGGFIQNHFISDVNFTAAIPSMLRSNYGCTYLGELFYNFGWLGTIVNALIGMFIGEICDRVDKAAKYGFSIKSLMFVGITPTIFTYIRGSFGDFTRIWVYYIVLLCILTKVTIKKNPTILINNSRS